jgi:hypothetical protein
MKKPKDTKPKIRNRKAAWTLALLTPVIAELAFGSTPLHFAYLLLLWLPIYGAGILLIREAVTRTGRGWPSIIVLGLAYEIAEDGLGLQALTSPHLYHAADWAPQIFGFNIAYWILNAIYHIVFSAIIPIFITNLLFPAFKDRPYLKKGGLVWVMLFALIGVGMLRGSVPPSQDPGYTAPVAVLIGCVVAIIALAVIALRFMPRKQPSPMNDTAVPSSKQLVLTGVVSTVVVFGLMYPFAGAHQPLFTHGYWAYIPIAIGTLLAVYVYKTIRSWGQSKLWNTRLALALAGGALVGHTIFGLVAAHLNVIDRIGLGIILVIMAWLLYRLYRKQPTVSAEPAITA